MVKAIINPSEAYNPFNRQRGIISNTVTRNSVSGNVQAINGATGCKIGDSDICSLKTEYSINLLTPVYRNKIINDMEMSSTMMPFDNQENENNLTNKLR